MIDEFARLNRIETIVQGLATLRSKKITICLVVQSLAQLDSIYGHEQQKIIADNCSYKAVLRATDADTQEYFSRLVGTHEVERKSVQKDTGLFWDESKGYTVSMAERRIIRPEEFAYLDRELVVFMPEGCWKIESAPQAHKKGRLRMT